jgi:hypothetical protein
MATVSGFGWNTHEAKADKPDDIIKSGILRCGATV